MLAFAVGLLLVTAGCERQERSVSEVLASDSVDAGPDQVSWDVNFALQRADKRRAQFIADKMEHFDTEDSSYVLLTMQPDSAMQSALREASIDAVGMDSDTSRSSDQTQTPPRRSFANVLLPEDRVIAYVFEEGDSSAVITAMRMMYFADEGRFEAFGDVQVVTTEQKRLYSEQLTWNQNSRKIRTRRFVRIVTPSEDVQGNGLVAEEDLDTYQIGRFTADVDIEDDEASAETQAEAPSKSDDDRSEPGGASDGNNGDDGNGNTASGDSPRGNSTGEASNQNQDER